MLKEKINQELISAQKEADILTVSVLRMLNAAIHNKQIEKRLKIFKDKVKDPMKFTDSELDRLSELEENEILAVIVAESKKRREAIELYQKGNRSDLVKKETNELEILEKFLPPAPSEEEVNRVVEEVIKETGARTKQDFGRVMKEAMSRLGLGADGSQVSKAIGRFLK